MGKDQLNPRYTRTFGDEPDDGYVEDGEFMEPVAAPTPQEAAEAKDMARVIAELTPGDPSHIIHISRGHNGMAKGSALFTRTPSDFRKDEVINYIKNEYGGGEYVITLRHKGQFLRAEPLIVELSLTEEQLFRDRKAGRIPAFGSSPSPQATSQVTDLMGMVALMKEESAQRERERQDQYNRYREREEARREREQAREEARQEREAARQQEWIKLLTDNKKNDGFDRMMQMMQTKMFENMMGEKKDTLTQVRELLEVSNLIGGGGEESTLQTVIKSFAKPVSDIAGAIALQAKMQAPQAPAGPKVINPPQGSEPLPAPEPGPAAPTEAELRALLKVLEKAAARDADVETYANMMIDQVGEENVKAVFTDEAMLGAILSQVDPVILENHGQWFVELREVVLELLDSEKPSVTTDTGNDEETPAIPDEDTD